MEKDDALDQAILIKGFLTKKNRWGAR